MNQFVIINISLCTSALLVTAMLMLVAGLGGNLRERLYRWFFITLTLNLLVVLNEYAIYFMQGHTGPPFDVLIRTLDFFSYLLGAMQQVSYACYLCALINRKGRAPKWFLRATLVISLLTTAMAAWASVHHLYAVFDATNHYQVQAGFALSQIAPAICIVLSISVILCHAKQLARREWLSLLAYSAILIACAVLETLVEELWLSHVGSTVAMLVIYVNIQVELKQQAQAQQAELTRARVAVMLSQIQPHFLYNSLTAISNLCQENERAQRALITFSEYLRGNMDSLSREGPIPFCEELEHVRQYLWLETLRFEERLTVQYDIRATDFWLPALSLQPIVENAVRHGVTKVRQGGTICIASRETSRAFVVTVRDDGAGFDPALSPAPGRSHVGLENARARLAALSAGSLTVNSAPGRGTTATIEIPKGGALS